MTRLGWTAPSAVAALMMVVASSSLAAPQANYQNAYPQATGAPYGQYQAYQPVAAPVQPQTTPYQVAQQQPIVQQYQPVQTVPPGYGSYQLPNYQAPAPGARYAMMQDDSAAGVPVESVPAPQPSAPMQYNEGYAPVQQYGGYGPSDCNCNTGATAGNWEGYVQAPSASYDGGCVNYGCETGSCNTGNCGGYNHDCDYGAFGGGSGGQLLGGRLGGRLGCGRDWFFGVYALGMTRDNPSYQKFAVLVDSPSSYPYYPTQSETILSTNDIKPDWQYGAEVRLGSTFGAPCGCSRPYAWEVVYWGLSEDDQMAIVTDTWSDTDRMYGQVNYAGLQYDRDGAAGGTYANRPLNDYVDYDMPINDPAVDTNNVRVLGFRVRNYFTAQNLELNFIKFPVAGCDPCCPSRFSMSGTCGIRYFKLDESQQYAAMYTTVDGTGNPNAGEPTAYTGFPLDDDNNIFHDIEVDNRLTGFQFGTNMNWLIGCKWSAFCDSQFGIYGNRICSYQTVYGGGGGEVTWAGSGNSVGVLGKKTDVSFLGEVRTGIGYQIGCNCRLTAAYRVVAITGVALAGEQYPTDWSDNDYVRIIDSNDSIVLHGVQTGVEWKY